VISFDGFLQLLVGLWRMLQHRKDLLRVALGKAEDGLALENPLCFLVGGLDHELIQRRALQLGGLLQSIAHFRGNPRRDPYSLVVDGRHGLSGHNLLLSLRAF